MFHEKNKRISYFNFLYVELQIYIQNFKISSKENTPKTYRKEDFDILEQKFYRRANYLNKNVKALFNETLNHVNV